MSLLAIKRRAESTTFEGERFEHLDLRSMKAFGAKFTHCTFHECKMDLSDMRTTRIDSCVFEGCELGKVDFSTSFVERTQFIGCNLEQSSFMGCYMSDVDFETCRMAYGETMFLNATARSNVTFLKCNLHGSNLDFREAERGVLRFMESNLWAAKIALGCAFWNAEFDEKTCQRFIGMVARVYPDEARKARLIEFACDQYHAVDRVMRGGKG